MQLIFYHLLSFRVTPIGSAGIYIHVQVFSQYIWSCTVQHSPEESFGSLKTASKQWSKYADICLHTFLHNKLSNTLSTIVHCCKCMISVS